MANVREDARPEIDALLGLGDDAVYDESDGARVAAAVASGFAIGGEV